ncbi:MAG: cyclic nucleotide-binding domain-containing protein [Candidatus Brocadiales bacterium]|nr:cyclic nucleotide-binding domain-containing protein [Candidatus Brocadiales bacterium]
MVEERLLGKVCKDGEIIIKEGSTGREMYVIQSGKVSVSKSIGPREILLATLGEGEVFGEMSLFDGQPRSATVKALGEARVLAIDHEMFLRKVRSDPSLALSILRQMGLRIRELDRIVTSTMGKVDHVQQDILALVRENFRGEGERRATP